MTPRPDDSTPSRATVDWALQALGCRAAGGVQPVRAGSTAVHVLELARRDGSRWRVVLRRFVDRERLATDPWYVPRHEAAALGLLEAAGLPTPRMLAADLDAAVCEVPTLVTTYLRGVAGGERPALNDRVLMRLAEPLPLIHSLVGEGLEGLPSYAPYYGLESVIVPGWSGYPAAWARALEVLRCGRPPEVEQRFVHRDYHPGNTLWTGQRLTGIIDWTTACAGPPGIDLARMRQNLARLHGAAAAQRFLAAYERVTGRREDRHPWWDLLDAVDLLADTPAPSGAGEARRLDEWERYVAGVVSELGGG